MNVYKVDKNVVEKLEIIKDRHPCLSLPNLWIYAVTVSDWNFILNYQNTSGKNFKEILVSTSWRWRDYNTKTCRTYMKNVVCMNYRIVHLLVLHELFTYRVLPRNVLIVKLYIVLCIVFVIELQVFLSAYVSLPSESVSLCVCSHNFLTFHL
jgi:hypothetical protein